MAVAPDRAASIYAGIAQPPKPGLALWLSVAVGWAGAAIRRRVGACWGLPNICARVPIDILRQQIRAEMEADQAGLSGVGRPN